jgi:LPS-assembly protein
MPLQRLVLVSFILSSFIEANEEIRKSFFEESEHLSQCTFYYPILSDQEKMDIESERTFISKESIFLEKDVVLKFDGGLFTSSSADLKENSNLINFNNNADIFLNDLYLQAQRGEFDRSNNTFELYAGNSYWKKPNIFISFETAKGANDSVTFTNASLSSCADTSSGWALKAEQIEINDDIGKGFAKKIRLEVFDKTVFRFPYLPVYLSEDLENNPKRHSRFLDPSISYSSDGFDFTLPYKKILSDNSDLVFGPRTIAKRGNGFEFQLKSAKDQNIFRANLIYLNSDKEFDKRYPSHKNIGDQRWGYEIKSSSDLQFGILNVNWSDFSDSHFFRDVPGESVNLNFQREEYFEQSISFQGNLKKLSYEIGSMGFESSNPILTNGYVKKPFINLEYENNLRNLKFESSLNFAEFSAGTLHDYVGYQVHEGKYLLLIENPPEGSRLFMNNSLKTESRYKNFDIEASIGIKSISYDLKNTENTTNDINVPNIRIRVSKDLFKTPIYTFGYAKTEDQSDNPIFDSALIPRGVNTFMNKQFSGYDRIADEKFHAIGFKYARFEDSLEKINFTVKKKFYFKDREVYLNNPFENKNDAGPIASSFSWNPLKEIKFNSYLNYSDEQSKINNLGLEVLYTNEKINIGIGQKFRRINSSLQDNLDLTEFFFDVPLESGYSIFALGQRDNETDKFIEARLGLGYENCCFAASLTASKRTLIRFNDINISNNMFLNELWDNIIETENKSRINISFQLKGFNSTKRGFKRYIQNSILN